MRAPPSDLPIVFEQVSLQASDVTVLRSVSLALGSGAPTALIGPNGAGKTTLIRRRARAFCGTSVAPVQTGKSSAACLGLFADAERGITTVI